MVVSDHVKTQEMCNEAVHMEPNLLAYAFDCFKIQKIWKEAVAHKPYALRFVPDHLKAQEMCDTAVRINPTTFLLTLYGFKTQDVH